MHILMENEVQEHVLDGWSAHSVNDTVPIALCEVRFRQQRMWAGIRATIPAVMVRNKAESSPNVIIGLLEI